MRGTYYKIDLDILVTQTWAGFFPLSVMEMTEGSQMHVCCARVFSFEAFNWVEYHVLSIGVLCRRALCIRCASHVLRHLHVFVKIRTIHETRCLWSVFKFLWFEDFNLPDVLRWFRLKLALLNETSKCWNARKGFPRFSPVLTELFLHTRPEFPWTQPGLGNVVLHSLV